MALKVGHKTILASIWLHTCSITKHLRFKQVLTNLCLTAFPWLSEYVGTRCQQTGR